MIWLLLACSGQEKEIEDTVCEEIEEVDAELEELKRSIESQ